MRRLFACLAALVLLLSPVPAKAVSVSVGALEETPDIEIDCASALLLEPESGQIIFQVNADEKRPVASVTKIMAILLCCEAIEDGRANLEDEVPISAAAEGMGGSQVLLDVGERQPLSVLLKSMIVGSANDATVAVGEYLYGSEQALVARMNERAAELHMDSTHFVNSTGLPAEGHYTTARDVAVMARELVGHETYFQFSTIWLDEVDHGDGRVTSLTNTNRLIRLYDGCDGIKTGSTKEAGYCMAASAVRGDMRLIAVVLGAETGKERFAIASRMLDHGFANYQRATIAEYGARVKGGMPVTSGDSGMIGLCLGGELTMLVNKGTEQEITLTPNLPESVAAPVARGQQVGTLDVLRKGELIARIPVVSEDAVARQGFFTGWRRVWEKWFYR